MEFAQRLEWQVDCGPEWLFVRLMPRPLGSDPRNLAEELWRMADERQRKHFVLEVDGELFVNSHLVGQIVLLHKRLHQLGGVLRFCAFPDDAYHVFHVMQLQDRFPNYASREDAVMGRKPLAK